MVMASAQLFECSLCYPIIVQYTFNRDGALTQFRTVDDDLAGKLGLGHNVDTYDGLMRHLRSIVPGPFDVKKVERMRAADHGIFQIEYSHSDAAGLDEILEGEAPVSAAVITMPDKKELIIERDRILEPPYWSNDGTQIRITIMCGVDFYNPDMSDLNYGHKTPDGNIIWADANHPLKSDVLQGNFR